MKKENTEKIEISNLKLKSKIPQNKFSQQNNNYNEHQSPISSMGDNETDRNRIETNDIHIRKKKKPYKYYFSMKYTIFLVTLWLVFLASLIAGFIVHFDIKATITASSIIWSFSAIMFIVSIVYSYLYSKAKRTRDSNELQKYLRIFPV